MPLTAQVSPVFSCPSEVMVTGEASFREQTQQGLPLSHSQGRGSCHTPAPVELGAARCLCDSLGFPTQNQPSSLARLWSSRDPGQEAHWVAGVQISLVVLNRHVDVCLSTGVHKHGQIVWGRA